MIWKKGCAAFSATCRWCLKLLIDAYVVVFSPHFGGRCRFHPSCSVYAREALDTYGPFRGSALMVRRLVKCGPWHPGGEDPVPKA
ncbi:membrane protein insertion efficiency factor YidD [bacterium]|nr:membrane protein insertion efficiency factor YidD [bacterium]